MTTYIYTGPLSGISLKGHGDIMLIPGATVALPDGHTYTQRLGRKGWLRPVTEPITPQPRESIETEG